MALTSENGEVKAKKAETFLFPPFPPDLIAVVKSAVDGVDNDGFSGGKVWKQRAISASEGSLPNRRGRTKANRERR